MKELTRITSDPNVMGGNPCIRGMRVTVGMVLGFLADGKTRQEILCAYPYLESEDIDACLRWQNEQANLGRREEAESARILAIQKGITQDTIDRIIHNRRNRSTD